MGFDVRDKFWFKFCYYFINKMLKRKKEILKRNQEHRTIFQCKINSKYDLQFKIYDLRLYNYDIFM